MRAILRSLVSAFLLTIALSAAAAAKPDLEFTRLHNQWLQNYVENLKLGAKRTYATDKDWCTAIEAWLNAHPSGEKKLTLEALIRMRTFRLRCPDPAGGKAGTDSGERSGRLGAGDSGKSGNRTPDDRPLEQAIKDFIGWHPDEFSDAPTEAEYVARRLLVWHYTGGGNKLLDAIKRANEATKNPPPGTSYQSRHHDLNMARARYESLRRAEIEKARKEWQEKHPDGVGAMPPAADGSVDPLDPNAWAGAGGLLTDEQWRMLFAEEDAKEAARKKEIQEMIEAVRKRVETRKDGTVDPLDRKGWAEARKKEPADGSVDPLDQVQPRRIDLGQRQTGRAYPFELEARNATCAEPQDFRFTPIGAPWLKLPQGNVAQGVGQGQTKSLPAQLDFSRAPPGTYNGAIEVTCDTCGWFLFKSCHIDKEHIELQVRVTP